MQIDYSISSGIKSDDSRSFSNKTEQDMEKKHIPWIIPIVFFIPLSADWNLIISKAGLLVNFLKIVPWASQSLFQLVFIIIALSFIAVCTSVTLYILIMLPTRFRDLEKSITTVSVVISLAFSAVEILFQFFSFNSKVTSVFLLTMLVYDVLNVG
ncbi:Protein CBG25356 [Caenorhabditis briggsae]|uniref:Serpentine receptor class gamma n=1 Tax=Caenorhabditis briggsae TaxID=6238 RepID=B6IIM0_CAEBR|nr:Protein CBG25356 [Caenorhabditis briggsae]CAR99750.1 Protein CBG25356 [Caenorhabditis briggsae]